MIRSSCRRPLVDDRYGRHDATFACRRRHLGRWGRGNDILQCHLQIREYQRRRGVALPFATDWGRARWSSMGVDSDATNATTAVRAERDARSSGGGMANGRHRGGSNSRHRSSRECGASSRVSEQSSPPIGDGRSGAPRSSFVVRRCHSAGDGEGIQQNLPDGIIFEGYRPGDGRRGGHGTRA